ncbi:MAG TPA: hypothetical protein VD788_08840 [Candidatus Polarisedimenticolaceae bacterium]|nr:hypothetical protein [Candidatus Polarisedimenticolaceae bacterium]
MNQTASANRTRSSHRIGRWAALAVTALLLATAADAHPRHHKHHGKHGHGHHSRHVVARVAPRPFIVPEVISLRYVDSYRPYFDGRVYHREHRHYHDTYAFPVYVDGHWQTASHSYCSGRRLPDSYVSFSGPRVSFGIRF